MSLHDEIEEYFGALDAIQDAGDDARATQQRVGQEHVARADAADSELQGIRDRRQYIATRLRGAGTRLDAAQVGSGPLERAVDPPAVTSLEGAIQLLDHYDAELDRTVSDLAAARAAQRRRRWIAVAALVTLVGSLGVLVAGGSTLFAGGCAAVMTALFVSHGVDHGRAYLLPPGCAMVCIVIASPWLAWWQILIGLVVFFFVVGMLIQGVERVQAAVRRDP